MNEDVKVEDGRFKYGKRFFIYMPALKGRRYKSSGEFISKRIRNATAPFASGQHPEKRQPFAWEYSVYYWWWEFLRRHDGYRDCCERGGKGRYKKLYADWGNIHAYTAETFWDWWSEKLDYGESRGEYLFAEPPLPRRITIADKVAKDTQTLTVNLPLEIRTTELLKFMRKFLAENKSRVRAARSISSARYPVAAKVRSATLFQVLRVWDVEQEYGHLKTQYEKSILAGINRETKHFETMEFRRNMKMAEDYIHFAVADGTFPQRRAR